MLWIICVAVVVILYFFIHFKIRNEVNEIEASIERTKTFVIMGNESNEIDVSKDLSISPSCNFQINGNGLRERKIQNLEISRTNIIIREDLQKKRNNSLYKCHNIDFGIINNKNKEDMNCFRKTRFKEIMNYFRKTGRFRQKEKDDRLRQKEKADRFRQKKEAYRLRQKKEDDRFRQKLEELKMDIAAIVSRRYRDIKLKTKNMPAPEPIKE